MHLKSGTLLQGGKYRIEKVLGQGGFGITYLAVQTNLKNRKRAIKEFFLREHCERDGSTDSVSMGTSGSKELVSKFKSKFIKEAETISELENDHIIRIIDTFEENNTAYYVMEYLSCGSLAERIPSDGLPESVALDYIRQICDALSYIHESKILHLDIKPSNILFRKNDEAVLIDFGISKHYDDEDGGQTSSTPVGVSEGYAPTEQYEREGVSSFSASTDIYALGATLYCLLCGHRPPKASIVLNDGLPSLPSSVSASTRAAVAKAMEPRRKDRPQSVADFLASLPEKEVTELDPEPGSGGKPEEKKPKSLKKLLLSIAAVLLLCLMGYGIVNSITKKNHQVYADEAEYSSFVSKADSLASQCKDLAGAIQACQAAVIYEERYAGTRYADSFNLNASEMLTELERRRNAVSYSNGVLTVKGIEYPMVYVAGGSFDMGSEDIDAFEPEKPVHRVTLSSYRIGQYEVTQDIWEAVMGNNPSKFKGPRRPVEKVSWNDCQEFIRKLNSLTGQNFKLPTEAQWEFAARGGNNSRGYKYSGSDDVGSVAWYGDNSGGTTDDVGTKSSNELGIYDMSGNVYEWCSDWYGSYNSGSQSDPKGPSSGSSRVCRGGSWSSNARYCRVSYRLDSTPDNRGSKLGLRLCL